VPGSDFHDRTYYRNELEKLVREEINASGVPVHQQVDEIVTFSMRFETGRFDSVNVLWQKDENRASLFCELIGSL
jgi:hypothetical protein